MTNEDARQGAALMGRGVAGAEGAAAGVRDGEGGVGPMFYVASRASNPKRPEMWRMFRDSGVMRINSTWIDEAGEGETKDLGELWVRIEREVAAADALLIYAEADDFPLKGAFIEIGMALAHGKPIYAVFPGVELEPRSMRPVGSWLRHPNVQRWPSIHIALTAATEIHQEPPAAASSTAGEDSSGHKAAPEDK